MKIIILVSIISLATASSPRIIGGEPARVGQFPYQAAIVRTNALKTLHCGATIISPTHVITAAHCFLDEVLHVRAGYIDFDNLNGNEQEVNVKSFTIHPDYSPSRFTNDIAVVELETPLVFGANVSAATLPESLEEVWHGTECFVSGWGSIVEGGNPQRQLRYAYLPAVADSECRVPYPNYIADSMLCAGFPAGGVDACAGDSGGPLVCYGKVQGVVSWGEGCAQPNFYGVYTQVSHFVNWIRQNSS